MSINRMLTDDVYIKLPNGEQYGPIKASVQGNKVFITDENVVIEEGGKIFRTLPNGKSEVHNILNVAFYKSHGGSMLSHYEITTQKESSLVATPNSTTTINILHSQGIQIGDQNVQHIVGALEKLCSSIDSSDILEKDKADVKDKLKSFISHPAIMSMLGSAAERLLARL